MRMSMKGFSSFIFVILLSFTTLAIAAGTTPVIFDANSLSWKKVPADPNLQYSVLAGNPNKKGLFVIRLKAPKGYTDVAHEHPVDQYDTIISGSYYLTQGDKADKTSAARLTAGTFILIPANLKHIGWTEEETVMQITSMGPWQGMKKNSRRKT